MKQTLISWRFYHFFKGEARLDGNVTLLAAFRSVFVDATRRCLFAVGPLFALDAIFRFFVSVGVRAEADGAPGRERFGVWIAAPSAISPPVFTALFIALCLLRALSARRILVEPTFKFIGTGGESGDDRGDDDRGGLFAPPVLKSRSRAASTACRLSSFSNFVCARCAGPNCALLNA